MPTLDQPKATAHHALNPFFRRRQPLLRPAPDAAPTWCNDTTAREASSSGGAPPTRVAEELATNDHNRSARPFSCIALGAPEWRAVAHRLGTSLKHPQCC